MKVTVAGKSYETKEELQVLSGYSYSCGNLTVDLYDKSDAKDIKKGKRFSFVLQPNCDCLFSSWLAIIHTFAAATIQQEQRIVCREFRLFCMVYHSHLDESHSHSHSAHHPLLRCECTHVHHHSRSF